MRSLPTEVLQHLESHHGVVSGAELRRLGWSAEDIRVWQRAGLLELVLHGAYRVRGQPLTSLGRAAAVCAAHPNCAIAGPTAGRIWALRRLPIEARVAAGGELIEPVHIIAPPGSQPTVQRWVRPYRTAAIHWDADVVVRDDGIRLTSRERTALDLARFVDELDLLSIIEQTLHDGHLTTDDLRRVAVDWQSPRRGWLERFLVVLGRVLPGRAAESHPEALLGEALRKAGVAGLVRQFEVHLPGYGRARFDLAVPTSLWAIEVDVFPTHAETVGRRHDERRDRAAHAAGWTVSRIGPEGFGSALPATVDRLVALARRLDQLAG